MKAKIKTIRPNGRVVYDYSGVTKDRLSYSKCRSLYELVGAADTVARSQGTEDIAPTLRRIESICRRLLKAKESR